MRLVIFGTGGMGREAADLARRSEAVRKRYAAIAFVADDRTGPVDGLPVLVPGEIGIDDEICLALGSPAERRRLAGRFEGHRFASLAAANAIVSPSARIGTGALLCDHSLVNNGATVGAHFQANVFSHVSHDCTVGDFVTFAPRVSCNGWVDIGDDVFVGSGAVIRNGSRERPLRIGAGAVIGMGAIVVADVAPGSAGGLATRKTARVSGAMRVKTGEAWQEDRDTLLAALRDFAPLLERAPFRNRYGLRGVSAFALFWFLRQVRPDMVFEVGVWRGFSTWLIEQAVPEAQIHCMDPMVMLQGFMSRWKLGRTYRSGRATYAGDDFSCAPIRELVGPHQRPLAFFDDHQNKLPRLLQCRAAGIRDIVFDDNMADAGTHRSLEDDRLDPDRRHLLEREIEIYEVFPALWPVDARIGTLHLVEQGLGFPIEPALRRVYDERRWHSSVTYVRLRAHPLEPSG